ncbi:MAG TPA: aspartyl-phosphate phosphatase Spo0E family protein [Bacilli bacterium]|nr:aspartyl-phosphate phosphatase Spo0E family protein [Bacilli bacterium]
MNQMALATQIAELRKHLHQVVQLHADLTSPEVVAVSQALDELLVVYQRQSMMKPPSRRCSPHEPRRERRHFIIR